MYLFHCYEPKLNSFLGKAESNKNPLILLKTAPFHQLFLHFAHDVSLY